VTDKQEEDDPLMIAAATEALRTGKPVYASRDERGEIIISSEGVAVNGVRVEALSGKPRRSWLWPVVFCLCATVWIVWWLW
jgi:hypothetical protein